MLFVGINLVLRLLPLQLKFIFQMVATMQAHMKSAQELESTAYTFYSPLKRITK